MKREETQRLRITVWVLGALAIALGWVSASALDVFGQRAEAAQLRVVHLVGGASVLDVWVDDALHFEALELRSVSRYVRLPAGEHLMRVQTAAGRSSLEETVTLQSGTPHTAVLVGSRERGFRMALLVDEFPQASEQAQAKVRLVNGLSDYGIRINAVLGDGISIAREVPPLEVGEYVAVPPGSYDLAVYAAEGEGDLLLSVQGLGFGPQTNYTLIVADLQGVGWPTTLFVVRDLPNPPVPAIIWVGLGLWALLLVRFVLHHLPAGP